MAKPERAESRGCGDLVSALVAAVYAHDHRHNTRRIMEAWANATF